METCKGHWAGPNEYHLLTELRRRQVPPEDLFPFLTFTNFCYFFGFIGLYLLLLLVPPDGFCSGVTYEI